MAEWLKTPRVVVSRDYLLDEMDSSRKLVGKSMNPTAGLINFFTSRVKTFIYSNVANIDNTNTTNTKEIQCHSQT